MSITRRAFLSNGALTLVGTTALPQFLARTAFGLEAPRGLGAKRLIVLFQRGAADGLNIVVPHGDPHYYQLRSSIAIPRPSPGQVSAIDLDGMFGLHPALQSLKPLWNARHLAIIEATGSPDTTRSHFDAQDYMESGTPGFKSTPDGWLNRTLRVAPDPFTRALFRAVALSRSGLPRILAGKENAIALHNISDFAVREPKATKSEVGPTQSVFQSMYSAENDTVLHGASTETFEAVKMLRQANPAQYEPAASANYPRGRFGDQLKQIAQLIKADLGVQVAFCDIGGWDHHVNEGSVNGQLANVLRDFSDALCALWIDLGDLAENTVIVSMSEFGRTAHQNGTGGTDHGHANVMFVVGGSVRGGKVYGQWPGLAPEQLNEGRDLALTTDFRTVLSEIIDRHLSATNLERVFPQFAVDRSRYLRFLG